MDFVEVQVVHTDAGRYSKGCTAPALEENTMRKKKAPAEVPKMALPPRVKAPLAGARLAPFSGDRTACTKCGHHGARTAYMSPGKACTHNGQGPRIVWGLERLHRTCERCQFAWDEACVPAIPVITHQTMVIPVVK